LRRLIDTRFILEQIRDLGAPARHVPIRRVSDQRAYAVLRTAHDAV
jgi:hypothetical protein